MTIPDKYRDIIITSLKYSIHYTREWHEKEASKYWSATNKPYYYDYEKNSIAPYQEALAVIKNTIKKPIK